MRKEYEQLADNHARAMVKVLTTSNEAYQRQVDRLIDDNNALAADLFNLSAEKRHRKQEQDWLLDALLDSRQALKEAEEEMEAMERIIETLIDMDDES